MPLLITIFFSLLFSQTSVETVVNAFHVTVGEKAELAFIEKYTSETSPSIKAYVIALEMKQAEHAFNPMTKLRIFKETKSDLEKLISANKTNVHARYIRLLVQEKTPSILDYNGDIETDKAFLKKKIADKTCSSYLVKHIEKNTSL